jgi:hypothetical protein
LLLLSGSNFFFGSIGIEEFAFFFETSAKTTTGICSSDSG